MYSDAEKMGVIININNMRNKCGLPSLDVDEQLKKDYDSLHEYQNSLVEHYNQAVKNGNMSQIHTDLIGGLIDCKEDDLKELVKEYQSFNVSVNDSLEYCKNHICGDPIKENQRIINELKPLGYTYDFDLGGEPYNLRIC